jgi:large subunit ribosomal protein L24
MERIKKGDQVIVIAGKDKSKKGEIIRVDKNKGLIVKGINIVKKSVKKSKEKPSGGFIEIEAPIHVSNAMLFCAKCGKGIRAALQIQQNGDKKRLCKKCGHKFE